MPVYSAPDRMHGHAILDVAFPVKTCPLARRTTGCTMKKSKAGAIPTTVSIAPAQALPGMTPPMAATALPDIAALEVRALDGDTDAMFALGCYFSNEDTRNYLDATKWLRMAAKEDHLLAMNKLGHVLIDQYSDYKEARQWFYLAVDQHQSIDAMMALGELYRTEASGVKEIEKSELWFIKASKLGNVDAIYELGMLCSEQDPRKKGMDTINWFKKAAKKGHAPSMYRLGVYYGRSDTILQDLNKSSHWFLHAANAGYLDALVPLGLLYMLPNGLTTNYILAYALFELARREHTEEHKSKQAEQQAYILTQHMQPQEIDDAIALSKTIYPPGKLLVALNAYLSK